MTKRHIIISGTGRAGTTFLVQLFTALGLDTGFSDTISGVFSNCNAGMEWNILHPNAPYIIKSPHLCDSLDAVLTSREITIEHALIPVRDLFSAAQSRREVMLKTNPDDFPSFSLVPGGLWHTDKPEHQEPILALQLYKLIYTLTKWDIPTTFLFFPRIIKDPDYLYEKTTFMLEDISLETFKQVFCQTVQPQLVHDFN